MHCAGVGCSGRRRDLAKPHWPNYCACGGLVHAYRITPFLLGEVCDRCGWEHRPPDDLINEALARQRLRVIQRLLARRQPA